MRMNASLSLAIPCRADEPGLSATLASLSEACQYQLLPRQLIAELVICINGLDRGTSCASLQAVRASCAQQRIALQEIWLEPEQTVPPRERDKSVPTTDKSPMLSTVQPSVSEDLRSPSIP